MRGPAAVSPPNWTSSLPVRLNLLIAGLLAAAVVLLGVVMPCSSLDLCLGAGTAGIVIGPAVALLVALALSGLFGWSIGLALVDVGLAAAIVGLSTRTILAVDIGGMLAVSAVLAVPFIGGVLATRQAAHGRLERWLVLGGLLVISAVFVIMPGIELGALVPLVVLPAIAFPMVPPWPYGEGPERSATLVGRGEDREE
jgi:hypothetical protein